MMFARMVLARYGFTPREVEEEWTWKEVEAFLVSIPFIDPLVYGGSDG